MKINLKTPNFWHKKNLIAFLLLPFSLIYLALHLFNQLVKKPKKLDKKVICIGNLVAGGAGKTPIALALGQILNQMQVDFAYLSKGYGANLKEFTKVENQSAKEVGDEPLLLKEVADSFICQNRFEGAKQICKKLIIMDDGFQNNSLFKDLNILVIDGKYAFGNGFLIPSGPVREPVYLGFKKADLIIIIGEDKNNIKEKYCQNKPVIFANIKVKNAQKFTKKPVLAFCGIGRPQKFFDILEQNKVKISIKLPFADHHFFENSQIERILQLAEEKNLQIVTTKKDWVRIDQKYREKIDYFDVFAKFEDEKAVQQELNKIINE